MSDEIVAYRSPSFRMFSTYKIFNLDAVTIYMMLVSKYQFKLIMNPFESNLVFDDTARPKFLGILLLVII